VPWSSLYPGGVTGQEDFLESLGFTEGSGPNQYEILPFNLINEKPLDPCHDLVIIASGQFEQYFTLAGKESYLYDFASAGGTLLMEIRGDEFSPSYIDFPYDIQYQYYASFTNMVINSNLPLVQGPPNPLNGFAASHGGFINLPNDATNYYNDDYNNITLTEFPYGEGKIWLSGQTYGFWYSTPEYKSIELMHPRLYSHLLCMDPPEMKSKQIYDSKGSHKSTFKSTNDTPEAKQ
jgi:hypothetical protein